MPDNDSEAAPALKENFNIERIHCLVKDRDTLLTFYDFPAEHSLVIAVNAVSQATSAGTTTGHDVL